MRRLIAALAVVAAGSLACSGGGGGVAFVTEGTYPPYNFIDERGRLPASSGSWETSFAGGRNSTAHG